LPVIIQVSEPLPGGIMILSASRRTDIPNYYSEWFLNRIKEGFLYVRNPMNTHQVSRIELSPQVVDCIVFWTKNPADMLGHLKELKEYPYYFQFTLTGYGRDIEPNLPDKKTELITTFQALSDRVGKARVIWRYDPVFINEKYTVQYHFRTFKEIACSLKHYTEKVVISFVDFYAKTQRNTKELNIKSLNKEELFGLARGFAEIADKNELIIETCAEEIELQRLGIRHGSCIDKELIERILGCRLVGGKDKNQREQCGCFESVEVGAYNTCKNRCKYCYANYNDRKVEEQIGLYDINSPLLCGRLHPDDKVTIRKMKSLRAVHNG